jgi:hypothetical protein
MTAGLMQPHAFDGDAREGRIHWDYMDIGPVPLFEECASLGTDGYPARSKFECSIYRDMLLRLFPIPDKLNARIVIKSFPYEGDSYREVCVKFDSDCQEAIDYAYRVEADCPHNWDEIALRQIANSPYFEKP